ncbi:MAG: RNA polymerase subunit sigma [bacterium]|nr:RNA polymerase subunit sigma [bacterium]
MSAGAKQEVTQLLSRLEDGDLEAETRVWNLLYVELRRLAHQARSPNTSLDTTALVHELYLRYAGRPGSGPVWQNRTHFFATAAKAMRQILVDRARRRQAVKRDGGHRAEMHEDLAGPDHRPEEVLAIHQALGELARTHPRHAQLVELRFFAGLTLEEAATGLDISRATAARDWKAAKGWLYGELEERRP